jgi:hypothetical protein
MQLDRPVGGIRSEGPAMGRIAVPPTRSSVLLARERDVSLDLDQANRFAGTNWCHAEDTGEAMCWYFRFPPRVDLGQ